VDVLALNGPVRNVTYGGDYLFAAMDDQICFINAMDPMNLSIINYYTVDGRAFDIYYQTGYIYVAAQNELQSFSVSGTGLTEVQSEAGSFYDITANGGMFYTASGAVVSRYDDTGAGTFDWIGDTNVDMAVGVSPFGANVAVADNDMVTVISSAGAITDQAEAAYDVLGVLGFGTYVIAAEGEYGAEVFGGTPLTQQADIPYDGGPRNITFYQDGGTTYAYVAYYLGGVAVLNVTDPSNIMEYNPVVVEPGTWTYDVEVVGDYLFVANYDMGVYVYDLANPQAPVEVEYYDLTGLGCRAIDSNDNNYLVVVTYEGGIHKFDISNPMSITLLGTTAIADNPRDVVLNVGLNHAYVAAYTEGCQIYDVSGNTPALAGTYDMSGVRSMDFIGDMLYVGSEMGDMDVVDITDPTAPSYVATFEAPGAINGVCTDPANDQVHLACWDMGFVAVDVTTPSMPVMFDMNDTYGLAKSCEVNNGTLFGCDSYGLYAYNPLAVKVINPGYTPDEYALMQNYPNPFNPETNLTFHVKKAGNVTITVYDVLGRQVATLVDGVYNAGVYEVQFDASTLTSGTYFAVLKAGDFSETKKMLLLK